MSRNAASVCASSSSALGPSGHPSGRASLDEAHTSVARTETAHVGNSTHCLKNWMFTRKNTTKGVKRKSGRDSRKSQVAGQQVADLALYFCDSFCSVRAKAGRDRTIISRGTVRDRRT